MASEVLRPAFPQDPASWHPGNIRMQGLMSAPSVQNPTTPFLTASRAVTLTTSPLFAIGTLDSRGRPWTTLWGGEKGCVSIPGQNMLGVNAMIDRVNDPVLQACLDGKRKGEIFGIGTVISALGIDLETRRRVKLSGKIAGATFNGDGEGGVAFSQVVLEVDSSLGNCPKYLNAKTIIPTIPRPAVDSQLLPLPTSAVSLIAKADVFFITASASSTHFSTNYRGGPRGFMRIVSNTSSSTQIAYPEYSGNRLYQTLGNLQVTPLAGLIIPDFETGDALYATCEAEILVQDEAAAMIPRTNLVVILTLKEIRFVKRSLAFRAADVEASPYNPPVRPLMTENTNQLVYAKPIATATLVERTNYTPDIARLKFSTDNQVTWKRGQHVALSFESELATGYAHMNNDDPRSLNDDLTRSFTVTSPPPTAGTAVAEFELVVRNVGKVTKHLLKMNPRAGMNASVLGFGGEFAMDHGNDRIGFLAGGVGITPLLGQINALRTSQIELWWSVSSKDINLVSSLIKSWEQLPKTMLFVSGDVSLTPEAVLEELRGIGIKIQKRRITGEDMKSSRDVSKWYICAGTQLKKKAEEWLTGKEIISEEFNY